MSSKYRLMICGTVAGFLLSACGGPPPSEAEKLMSGTHQLREMNSQTGTAGHMSGNFLGFSGSAGSQTEVTFAWKANDGSYVISTIPIEELRIRFDPRASIPTIEFSRARGMNGIDYSTYGDDIQGYLKNFLIYGTLTIREEDWPKNIELPLNPKTVSQKN